METQSLISTPLAIQIARLAYGSTCAYLRMLTGNALLKWEELWEGEKEEIYDIVVDKIRPEKIALQRVAGPILNKVGFHGPGHYTNFIPETIKKRVTFFMAKTIDALIELESGVKVGGAKPIVISTDKDRTTFSYETLRPLLSEQARTAAENTRRSTIAKMDNGNLRHVKYFADVIYTDDQGRFPWSFIREYAKMLNRLARLSWFATLAMDAKPLAHERDQRPRSAVYTFAFFADPAMDALSAEGWNQHIGNWNLQQTEGVLPTAAAREPEDFKSL